MKDHYQILEITPDASADDIKRAFRAQIAKYHPDKVQHLGKEFQDMAAGRAAELTEAYRILSDPGRRAEYDKSYAAAAAAPPPAAPTSPYRPAPSAAPAASGNPASAPESRPGQFVHERASRDRFVRKATLDRFRQAFTQVAGPGYDESQLHGFDFASTPRPKMFSRAKGPCLLGRFVSRVDAASVADAWSEAGRWNAPSGDEICVILMGTALATPRELADAIAEQRRRSARGSKVTLIPVNSSAWEAHMPTDAPGVAKDLLARLKSGKS